MKLQKTTQAWFELPDDPDKSAFEIKHLRAGKISKITEATAKRKFEFRKDENGEMVPVPIMETNGARERELVVVEAVTDWKNVFDQDGKRMECNNENKIRLCRELDEEDFATFLLFIQACRRKLAESLKEQAEEKEKN